MNRKLFAAGLMLVALFGGAFAFFGYGMGFGLMGSQDVSDEVRFDMMGAMHNGDWNAFSALAQENGIEMMDGMDEESFALRASMNEALESGDYETYSAVQEQMREKREAFAAENGFEGRGKGMGNNGRGMHREGGFDDCPFAEE